MNGQRRLSTLWGLVLLLGFASFGRATAEDLPAQTQLDEYVRKPDDSYRWKIVRESTASGQHYLVVDMVSQKWLDSESVDRTEWQHWLTLAYPEQLRTNVAFLYISGGSNGGEPPEGPSEIVRQISRATGGVVAELRMVPNQSLEFHHDGKQRSEDDLIGYTWSYYLDHGDPVWLARNPMVNSAVRAMDTITAVMQQQLGEESQVNRFVVAGGSKRGWTTWLTGAVDPRVVAIVPIVIDVLNVHVSMQHHFEAYGFWAPAVGDYVRHGIMERFQNPRLQEIYHLVDPYYYRHRLTMPKYIVNAAGDQFFLPDSSQFYWNDLQGEKYLRYVPNADHGLGGSDAMESITAFYGMIAANLPLPQFSWEDQGDSFHLTLHDQPRSIKLWQARNRVARDFRLETLGPKYTSRPLKADADGQLQVALTPPDEGWSASFVELTFDTPLGIPLKLTTNVRVLPDVLPFSEKPLDQTATLTIVCNPPAGDGTDRLLRDVQVLLQQNADPSVPVTCDLAEGVCYFNWKPKSDWEGEAKQLTGLLQEKGCNLFRYQLESGPGATRPSMAP